MSGLTISDKRDLIRLLKKFRTTASTIA